MIAYRGNLTDDVEVKELVSEKNGKTYVRAHFRIAVSNRYRDSDGKWQDGDRLFWTCEAWGPVARGLRGWTKGAPILVMGEFKQSQYDAPDGSGKRTRTFLKVAHAGTPVWDDGKATDEGRAKVTADGPTTQAAASSGEPGMWDE